MTYAPHTAAQQPMTVDALGPRIPIYTPEFAADPHGHYRAMREQYGDLVPVEIWPGLTATLVIGYNTALAIGNDTAHYSSDPTRWERTLTPELRSAPVMGMLKHRRNALFSDADTHKRYRDATNYALDNVDLSAVRKSVGEIASRHINRFISRKASDGYGYADLLAEYAQPLAFEVLCTIVGCPAHLGEQVAAASGMLFEGANPDTVAAVDRSFGETFGELAALKKTMPSDDIATRLLQHPAGLDADEFVANSLTFFSAGSEIPQNWIANTLCLILTDDRYLTTRSTLQLSTRTALEEVLHTDPPLANYCALYPRGPQQTEIMRHGRVTPIWLDANQPVLVSMAACTTSPEVQVANATFTEARHNLAWGLGAHECPGGAQRAAKIIAEEAIDYLLDCIPEVETNFPEGRPEWRPGPFHRALAALPVRFPPGPPIPYVG
ncbi:cytochrome P450 [Nocardia carnea]|uniref:cytochrome P450 n=1 Tax=Nocardia carnea TaxID=37328 RepID=UPI000302CACA|nr:cytochrome P450 [Nocardia carnea]